MEQAADAPRPHPRSPALLRLVKRGWLKFGHHQVTAHEAMTTTQSNVSAARPLRLWPGITIVAAVWAARLAAPAVVPGPLEELMVRGFSSLGGTLAVAIWWLLFSRASQRERWAIAGV